MMSLTGHIYNKVAHLDMRCAAFFSLMGFGFRPVFDDLNDWFAKKLGNHGKSGDGEIVFAAQPPRDFAWPPPNLVGKLFLGQASFLHQSVNSIGDLKRSMCCCAFFRGYFGKQRIEVSIVRFHNSNVLSVSMEFSVMTTEPSFTLSFSSSSNFWRVTT